MVNKLCLCWFSKSCYRFLLQPYLYLAQLLQPCYSYLTMLNLHWSSCYCVTGPLEWVIEFEWIRVRRHGPLLQSLVPRSSILQKAGRRVKKRKLGWLPHNILVYVVKCDEHIRYKRTVLTNWLSRSLRTYKQCPVFLLADHFWRSKANQHFLKAWKLISMCELFNGRILNVSWSPERLAESSAMNYSQWECNRRGEDKPREGHVQHQ